MHPCACGPQPLAGATHLPAAWRRHGLGPRTAPGIPAAGAAAAAHDGPGRPSESGLRLGNLGLQHTMILRGRPRATDGAPRPSLRTWLAVWRPPSSVPRSIADIVACPDDCADSWGPPPGRRRNPAGSAAGPAESLPPAPPSSHHNVQGSVGKLATAANAVAGNRCYVLSASLRRGGQLSVRTDNGQPGRGSLLPKH